MFSMPGPRNIHEFGVARSSVRKTRQGSVQSRKFIAARMACGFPQKASFRESPESPTSFSIRSSNDFKSCHPCRRISQVSTFRIQVDNLYLPLSAPGIVRSGSRTVDCDILCSIVLAERDVSRGARPLEPGMPCQQSIYSLACPRFSNEGRRCPANCHR